MKKKLMKHLIVFLIAIGTMITMSGCKKVEKDEIKVVDKSVYESPLISYMEGLKNKDLTKVLQAYPEFMHMDEKVTQTDIDNIYTQYESIYGANVTLEYTLDEAVDINDDVDKATLMERIKDLYPDVQDFNIDMAKIITVELKVSGDGLNGSDSTEESEQNFNRDEQGRVSKTDKQDYYVYRYNDNWYIF